MPLVHVTTNAQGLTCDAATRQSLLHALAETDPGAPIVILVHGYKYCPDRADCSPHRSLFAYESQSRYARAISWPARLGLTPEGTAGEPLVIGFGWPARGSIWNVYHQACKAGQSLAKVISTLKDLAPERAVDVMGHSLGARVILQALPDLPAGAIRQAVFMAAAEFQCTAQRKLATPAGRRMQVLNVITGENRVFDGMLEWLIAPLSYGARSLGRGFPHARRNWCDLPIDRAEGLLALARLGLPIAPPAHRVCHWSVYMRPGIFGLYRAALRDPGVVARLKIALSQVSAGDATLGGDQEPALPVLSLLPFGQSRPS